MTDLEKQIWAMVYALEFRERLTAGAPIEERVRNATYDACFAVTAFREHRGTVIEALRDRARNGGGSELLDITEDALHVESSNG